MFDDRFDAGAASPQRGARHAGDRVIEPGHPAGELGWVEPGPFDVALLGPDRLDLDPWAAAEPRPGGAAGGGSYEGGPFDDQDLGAEATALLADELTGKLPGADLAYLLDRGRV